MYKIEDIVHLTLETSTRCQAKCPMCPRRKNGKLNEHADLTLDISLNKFKEWFPPDFIKQLKKVRMCGNLGDPMMAKDTLEIFRYIRENNKEAELFMNTNGGARNEEWWSGLADINVEVIFALDGLEDTHSLYRINVDWNKVINNAKTFIGAGGRAHWHMLVFKHNEHQVKDCENISKDLGFVNFSVKYTSRFPTPKNPDKRIVSFTIPDTNNSINSNTILVTNTGCNNNLNIQNDNEFAVYDEDGNVTHFLSPTNRSKLIKKKSIEKNLITNKTICCIAAQDKKIYVSATGHVTPCCWLSMSGKDPSKEAYHEFYNNIKQYPSLYDMSLKEIFDSGYFEQISSTFTNNPLKKCLLQCGKSSKHGLRFSEKLNNETQTIKVTYKI